MNKMYFVIAGLALIAIVLAQTVTQPTTTIPFNSSNSTIAPSIPSLDISSIHYNTLTQAIASCAVCTKNIAKVNQQWSNAISSVIPGNYIYYSKNVNGTLYVWNVSVVKAEPPIGIQINGQSYAAVQNGSTEIIHIPILNGHLGVTGGNTYPLNISLSTNSSSPLNIAYQIQVTTNGTVLASGNSILTTFSKNLNYQIPVQDIVSIDLSTPGNPYYTSADPVTVPTNILAYIPITLTNYAFSPVLSSTPLLVGASGTITSTGGVQGAIGINALYYKQYETCNLNNGEFFNAAGGLITSWLYGNVLSPLSANGICTGNSANDGSNTLYTSQNVVYWVTGIYIPANTGTTPGTNVIYLGWTGNVVSTANNLFSTTTTGEAPQLSCNNPGITNTVTQCNYAQYDNGAQIFWQYDNFQGFTLNSNLWLNTGNCGCFVANGLHINAISGGSGVWSSNSFATGTSTDFLTNLFATGTNDEQAGGLQTGSHTQWDTPDSKLSGTLIQFRGSAGSFANTGNILNPSPGSLWTLYTTNLNTTPNTGAGTPGAGDGQANYGVGLQTGVGSSGSAWTVPFNALLVDFSGAPIAGTYNAFFDIVRPTIPGNFYDGYSASNVVIPSGYVAPTTPTITITNTVLDVGQYQTITSTTSLGTTPYSYNFLVYNSITNKQTENMLISSSSTTVAFTYAVVTNDITNSLEYANVFIIDQYPNTVNSILSIKFGVNSVLSTPIVSPSITGTADVGEAEPFNAYVTGGSPSYTYNFLIYNSVTNFVVANLLTTSNNLIYTVPANQIGNTLVVNVFVTDSASTPVTKNSILSGVLTINTGLVASPPTPTTPTIDNGRSVLLTAQPSGGTPGYTYQWYTDNNNNCISLSIIGGATSSTYLAAPTSSTYYCYIVIDSAIPIPATATSTAPANVAVDSALGIPIISPSGTGSYNIGTTIPFNAYVTGGSPSYTYNFLIYNSVTNFVVANLLTTSNNLIYTVPTNQFGNTLYANVFVTDISTNAPITNSILSGIQTITAAALTANPITPSNPTIVIGSSVTLTANPTGGVPSYTYSWYTSKGLTNPGCNSANAIAGSSSTFSAGPISTNTYAYKVTDTQSSTACSAADTVTVVAGGGTHGAWNPADGDLLLFSVIFVLALYYNTGKLIAFFMPVYRRWRN